MATYYVYDITADRYLFTTTSFLDAQQFADRINEEFTGIEDFQGVIVLDSTEPGHDCPF